MILPVRQLIALIVAADVRYFSGCPVVELTRIKSVLEFGKGLQKCDRQYPDLYRVGNT